MNPAVLAFVNSLMGWMQWFVGIGMSAFANAWNTSKKATEVILVLAVLFAVAVWLGVAHAPKVKVPADDAAVLKAISELSTKLDKASCPAPVVTGSITKATKKK